MVVILICMGAILIVWSPYKKVSFPPLKAHFREIWSVYTQTVQRIISKQKLDKKNPLRPVWRELNSLKSGRSRILIKYRKNEIIRFIGSLILNLWLQPWCVHCIELFFKKIIKTQFLVIFKFRQLQAGASWIIEFSSFYDSNTLYH